ncbi:MAG: hypothetical protein ACREPD_11995 [Stenotrophomonas sp.]|uniref:hypothetical protein n=1 Tax=Stenotrophomonas sp. TaxID=69392 RepID=UPI003D6CDF2F
MLIPADRIASRDGQGLLCLGVMTGGFALYEIAFPLSASEQSGYAEHGKEFLDALAYRASRDPGSYVGR